MSTENHENHDIVELAPEKKKVIEQRIRECELALSNAKRELMSYQSMRLKVLSRIEEINHDIAFLTEHLAFPDLVEPYDFDKPVRYSDYVDADENGEPDSEDFDEDGNAEYDGSAENV